jgi:hypothetical protein
VFICADNPEYKNGKCFSYGTPAISVLSQQAQSQQLGVFSRAYGIALGFLLPAAFALIAIRLRWVAYPVDVARWLAALSLNPARLLASF